MSFASGVEPVLPLLEDLLWFTWLRGAGPMSLGTKFFQVLLTSNELVLASHWLLVIWVSSFFLPLLLLLYLCGLCVGVDNALIKGDTWLICAHVILCDE